MGIFLQGECISGLGIDNTGDEIDRQFVDNGEVNATLHDRQTGLGVLHKAG